MLTENILLASAMIFILGGIIANFFLEKKMFLFILAVPAVILLILLIDRILISGHVPFTSIYETLIFFSFLYLTKILFSFKWDNRIIAIVTIPVFIILLAALFMPAHYRIPSPLSPALQSFWLIIHVPCFFIGYLSLFISFIISITGFFRPTGSHLEREIKTSYFFMCAGLVTGGIWADISWGAFWSWDPKETGALVTIIMLSISFLFKSDKMKFAVLLLTFLSLLFTYLGISFLLPGLHSYAG